VRELQAFLCDWKGLHPFYYHVGDFFTPRQDELSYAETLQAKPDFSPLKNKQWLDRPQPKRLKVDHRYASDYYETTAGIYALPDGGIVIQDGYGSEIRMTGGSIFLTCPGDVWRMPGRSCIDWAGDDHIIKANNSVDITSSNKDVRVKAEHNLEMLAANSDRPYVA
jgi:hypothetical protein